MRTRREVVGCVGAAIAAIPASSKGEASVAKRPVVCIFGDSIAAGYGLAPGDALPAQLQAALYAQYVLALVRGAGRSGDTTGEALTRLNASILPETDLCIIELGGNDFLRGLPPTQMAANLAAIAMKLKARHIDTIMLGGHAPAGTPVEYGREFTAAFGTAAVRAGVLLIPGVLDGVLEDPALMQTDRIHPNAAGVRKVVSRLVPTVIRCLAAAAV